MMLYKIAVLGEGGVGKTSLSIQLCLNHFIENYDPTIDDSYRKQFVIDEEPCVLEIFDTAGQEEYDILRDHGIRDAEGFVLVYSIAERGSYERIERFHTLIQEVKKTDQIPIMLTGNKCDRITDREVSREEGMTLSKRLHCDFVETSAKTCVNVERSFYSVVRLIRKRREVLRRVKEQSEAKEAITKKKKPIRECRLL